jgi:hypothetical protein
MGVSALRPLTAKRAQISNLAHCAASASAKRKRAARSIGVATHVGARSDNADPARTSTSLAARAGWAFAKRTRAALDAAATHVGAEATTEMIV